MKILQSRIFCFALATLGFGAMLLFLSNGRELLDTKFHYSPYEALGFFSQKSEEEIRQFSMIAWADLLLFLPAYGGLLFLLSQRTPWLRTYLLVAWGVATCSDAIETSLILLGLRGIGWESAWLPSALSAATPLKWLALIFWLLLFSFGLFRNRWRG